MGLEPNIPALKGLCPHLQTTGPHAQLILSCSCQTRFFLLGCLLDTFPLQQEQCRVTVVFTYCLQTTYGFNYNSPSISTPHARLLRQGRNRTFLIFSYNSPSSCITGQIVDFFREPQSVFITIPEHWEMTREGIEPSFPA